MKMTLCLGHHPINVRKVLARRWAPPSRSSALSLQSPKLGQIEAKSSKHHHAQARQHTAQRLQTHLSSSSWDFPPLMNSNMPLWDLHGALKCPGPTPRVRTQQNPTLNQQKKQGRYPSSYPGSRGEESTGLSGAVLPPPQSRPGVQPDHPQVEPITWGERRGPSRRAAASTAAPLSQIFEQRAKGSCCSY